MAGGRIPEEIVQKIKDASDIVTVIEQYLKFDKKSGSNYFALCPFHQEDSPSFSVSPSKQMFYCFGCHKGGDVVNFVKEIEHTDYVGALRILAERAGIVIPAGDDRAYQEQQHKRQRLYEIMHEAALFYCHQLGQDSAAPAQRYLQSRGIQADCARHFGLGYAGEAWDQLYRHCRQRWSDEELLDSGLFKRGKNGRLYDLFRGRLLFPIMSGVGKSRVLAYGGRVLDDSRPKYINSPETPIYHKSDQVYGLNFAKRSKAQAFLLVEGYLDVISLHQAGFTQAVAPLGTALTREQARLLRQFKSEVQVCFDSDAAGQKAALRAIEILEAEGLEVKILRLPAGAKDPDELLRQSGAPAFEDCLKQLDSVADFRFALAEERSSSGGIFDPERYLREVMAFLLETRASSLREIYMSRAAQRLGISLDSLKADLRRQERGQQLRGGQARSRQPDQAGQGRSYQLAEGAAGGWDLRQAPTQEQRKSAGEGSGAGDLVERDPVLSSLSLYGLRLLIFLAALPAYQKDYARDLEAEDIRRILQPFVRAGGGEQLDQVVGLISRALAESSLSTQILQNSLARLDSVQLSAVLARETLEMERAQGSGTEQARNLDQSQRGQREELRRFFYNMKKACLQERMQEVLALLRRQQGTGAQQGLQELRHLEQLLKDLDCGLKSQ